MALYNKLISVILLIPCLAFGFTYVPASPQEEERLHQAVGIALSYPEAKRLYQRVQTEGAIRIIPVRAVEDLEACWGSTNRHILINMAKQKSTETIIASILFELQNAVNSHKLDALYNSVEKGHLSQETFAEQIERIEYENLVKAHNLLEEGKRAGYYPRACQLPRFSDFADYLATQEEMGHTDYHRQVWRSLTQSTF